MRLGVDFGGTKIEAALLDSEGEIRLRQRTPNPGGYDAALAALAALVARIESEAGVRAETIGVAVPGSLSPRTQRMRNANSTWLNGRAFQDDLRLALGRPLRMANDANCFALSEAVDGAASGARSVFGVILGTGCGGGVAIEGRVLEGASGVAGEWGHIPLPWPRADEVSPARCWCGRMGCMETWVSGPAFERWSGTSPGEAYARARQGDPVAIAALDLLADRIARGLAVVIDVLDPEVIVLGGGLSNMDALYPSIQGKLIAHVFSDFVAARVVKNKHGDSSGVRGAAWLFQPGEAQ